MTAAREHPVVFGSATPLLGIVTEPAEADPQLPAVVLLSAGLLHRIGPNRLYVTLARRLAARGFTVLRFDHAGLGDSQPRVDRKPFEAAAQDETTDAIAFLAGRNGATRFVTIGLCSGADRALRAAAADARVVAAALVDPFYEATPGYLGLLYARLLLRRQRWRRLLGGQSGVWRRVRDAWGIWREQRTLEKAAGGPDRRQVAAALRAVAGRGTRLCLVFSAEGPGQHHYERAFARALRGVAAPPEVAVVHDTDHVFTPLRAQHRLVDLLVDWAGRLAPALASPVTARAPELL